MCVCTIQNCVCVVFGAALRWHYANLTEPRHIDAGEWQREVLESILTIKLSVSNEFKAKLSVCVHAQFTNNT